MADELEHALRPRFIPTGEKRVFKTIRKTLVKRNGPREQPVGRENFALSISTYRIIQRFLVILGSEAVRTARRGPAPRGCHLPFRRLAEAVNRKAEVLPVLGL